MSTENRLVSATESNQTGTNSVVAYYPSQLSLSSAVSYTSSLIVHLQQLQQELHTQYQHEKQTLTELNRQFHLFIQRVQQLESQNAKYLVQISEFRRQMPNAVGIDEQSSQHYLHFQSDLLAANKTRVDHEFDFELSQIESAIYRQLIEAESSGRDQQKAKLEQELKQIFNSLNTLKMSYGEKEAELGRIFSAREEANQKYLQMSKELCQLKKRNREEQLNIQSLKSFQRFYQNLSSNSTKKFESTTIHSKENKDFWSIELENAIKKIRRDFESLYGSLHHQMVEHYNRQIEETQIEFEQSQNTVDVEYERFVSVQQTLQVEYEKTQQTYSYEKEVSIKLESNYSKLESDYKALQLYHDEQLEMQMNDITARQESLMNIAYDIDDMRARKLNLEQEIIVYRHLLGLYSGQESTIVSVPQTNVERSELVGKYIVNNKKKGSIGIKECAPNGAFITLINHSTTKEIDLSRWILVRCIDSTTEYRYQIPDGIRLQRGEELRIYSKLGFEHYQSSPNYRATSPKSKPDVVNRELSTWGSGNRVETFLFNLNGEEKASHLQSVAMEQKKF